MRPLTFEDSRRAARRRLPHMLFEYIDGGAYDEVTLGWNRADLERQRLKQRVLRDMSLLNLATDLCGEALAMPVALGPVGFAGMFARRGEVQAARAAAERNLPFCVSAVSICDYEEVARASPRQPWFQLYMIRDRGYMAALLGRVQKAGARVLVFTVDLPTPGTRYRDGRSGLHLLGWRGVARQMRDGLLHPGWLWDVWLHGRPHRFGNFAAAMTGPEASLGDYWQWTRDNFDSSTDWADLDWVRTQWRGPIIVKGIMTPEDAVTAAEHGADAITVSNHGGRQLDSVRSSISALPGIAATLDRRVPILFDGGIPSGLDVLKALASGADACLLARSWAFALAAGGEAAIGRMLVTIEAELRVAMILTGCADVREAAAELLDGTAG